MVHGRKSKGLGLRRQAAQAQREAERQAIRADALGRYARMKGGRPALCTPPPAAAQARVNSGVLWPKKTKVIFNSLADAEAFAQLVRGLDGKVQSAYLCEYSQHGHAHLTTDD